MANKRINWDFRPKGYFGVLDSKRRILNRIQGTMRRSAIEAALEEGDPASVPSLVIGEQLDEGTRQAFGRLHPAMMGGEFLPALRAREVEIARVELQSVTGDVISIRAREGKSRITYSIVDEYDMKFSLAIKSSLKPLTLRQIVNLIQKSFYVEDHLPQYGIALSNLVSSYEGSGQPLEELEGFVSVRSDFYRQLGKIFQELCDDFMLNRAFDGLTISARDFLAQFTEDERGALESSYGRPWHTSFREHLEEIEGYGVNLLDLKRRFGPPQNGWLEHIIKQLEKAVEAAESKHVPKLDADDTTIVKLYSQLSKFETLGGPLGFAIGNAAVNAHCMDYFKRLGQLPCNEQAVPRRVNDSISYFHAIFPDTEIAQAASLAMTAAPSRRADSPNVILLADIVPALIIDSVQRVDISIARAGLGAPPNHRQQWCITKSDEVVSSVEALRWDEDALQAMIIIFRRLLVSEKSYVPYFNHTDDYPSIKIRLALNSGEITIGSQSQGSYRIPWFVHVDGRCFVADNAMPSLALCALKGMVKSTVLEQWHGN